MQFALGLFAEFRGVALNTPLIAVPAVARKNAIRDKQRQLHAFAFESA